MLFLIREFLISQTVMVVFVQVYQMAINADDGMHEITGKNGAVFLYIFFANC